MVLQVNIHPNYQTIIEEGSDKQFWKQLPGRTFISKFVKSYAGYKACKDNLILPLGGSVEGNFKFLVYHSENLPL